MRAQSGISRRHMLTMTAAATSLSIGGNLGGALAQSGKRIERFAPELDNIISTSEPIRDFNPGTGGPGGPTEGPVWFKEGGYLLFSDIFHDRRMKYTPGQGVTVFKEKTNRANGVTRDLQGRLVAAERDTRRVTRQEADGSITVIANSFQGRRLNITNDVVVKSDGAIYFTVPKRSSEPEPWDVAHTGVYRVSPDLGTVTLLVEDFAFPNGLAFSPDENVLYINDLAARPHPGLQRRSERHAGTADGPDFRRPPRIGARRAGWNESGLSRQCLLRRLRRALHPRSEGQEARPHRSWISGYDKSCIRR